MQLSRALMTALLVLFAASSQAFAHLFTDDQGRTVEADLVGIRGDRVVLAVQLVRGSWPLKRLSPADQKYAEDWRKQHTAASRIGVRLFAREGQGKATSAPKTAKPPGPPVPGLPAPPLTPLTPKIETRSLAQHYEVELNNAGDVDATTLTAETVLYTVLPDGNVSALADAESVSTIPAQQSVRLKTKTATTQRTKTTQLKVGISNRSITTTKAVTREQERLGGAWVKVFDAEHKLIGEAKSFTPELEELSPSWEEVAAPEAIPELPSLGALLEMVKKALPPGPQR